ncbi:tryptophan permease, partial [Escherichia coli O121]|nr:tryptophan permease [Escherichia coli O121]
KRKDKLIKSVVFGSLLALVIYLFWLYCTMGNIPRESFKAIISSGGNVDSLVKSFLGTKQHGIIEFCLLVFSNLAVASSFFGVTLGLFDYLADLFKIDNSHGGRFKTVLLTFLPPALLYLIFPNG